MTCVVGYVYDKKVYMGCDSAGVVPSTLSLRTRQDKKVFIKSDMIYGFCGSYRMGQIIRSCFDRPLQDPSLSDYDYLCSTYMDELRKCFCSAGFMRKEHNVEDIDGSFLLGFNSNLYQIETDLQVGQYFIKYAATGCAEDYAMGVLYGLEVDVKLSPEERILKALHAAQNFSAGVRSPFFVECLEQNKTSMVLAAMETLIDKENEKEKKKGKKKNAKQR